MKIKIQCSCGKRLLVLLSDIGQERECPRCKNHLRVPTLESGEILAVFCVCKSELTALTCANCQQQYSQVEPYFRAKLKLFSPASPVNLPVSPSEEEGVSSKRETHSIQLHKEAFSVKFQCSCGKRITAPATAIGKTSACKLCNRSLVVPALQETGFLGFLCHCETFLTGQEEECPQCKTPLYLPEEASRVESVSAFSVSTNNKSSLPEVFPESSVVDVALKTVTPEVKKTSVSVHVLLKLVGLSFISSVLGLLIFLHVVEIYKLPMFRESKTAFDTEYEQRLALDQKFQEELKKASQIPKPEILSEENTGETSKPRDSISDPKIPDSIENNESATEKRIEDLMKELFHPEPKETVSENINTSEKNDPPAMSIQPLTPPKVMEASVERELQPMPEIALRLVEGLDFDFFKERIQPILAANCSSTQCHGGPGKLEPPADDNRIRYNYNKSAPFVLPSNPEKSLLLQKPLAVSAGGMSHTGGDLFDRKSPMFIAFTDWIQGKTLETASPLEIATDATEEEKRQFTQSKSCLTCHQGIEEMHPWSPLGCVDCHGGDPNANSKQKAHVQPQQKWPNDERVLPLSFDPDYLRFRNPSNLRIVDKTCGNCHAKYVENFKKSLHGTTAGHLSDGYYETGKLSEKESVYSIFPVSDDDGQIPSLALRSLKQVPAFSASAPKNKFETHYADLARKSCMRCHFWSTGQAVRGRLGQDGDYRAEGCAGCHVRYELDGLSRSLDPTIKKFEPGHPSVHQMTSRIPTNTCVSCHYGDASIGLNFRGLSQLIPGMPGGPEVKGTTNQQMNGVFYLNDPKLNPADIHHQRGMNCIDCHTLRDVMGDGNIYGAMEHAVEIECIDCHGTLDQISTMTTSRGRALTHLSKGNDGEIYLTGKIDGKRRRIKQAKNVVTQGHRDYNARATQAMTKAHERLECYSCHSGWSINFFGFHFDRNESFTQLDLLSGQRTPGRVSTQEKVFASFKQIYLGFSSEGMIAPYMVGFSTMGTVWDKNGRKIMDHRMPETHAGLSGMTMIHHQLHNVQRFTRTCTECHRSSATYGMGSKNYRLARHFFYTLTDNGIEAVALDKKEFGKSLPVSTIELEEVESLALLTDKVQGEAQFGYAAVNEEELAVLYLKNPAFPSLLQKIKLPGVKYVMLSGEILYACCQDEGLLIFSLKNPQQPRLLTTLKTENATHCDLAWPHLYLADAEGGLKVIDVRNPKEAKVVGTMSILTATNVLGQTTAVQGKPQDSVYYVKSFFQYGKLNATGTARQTALHLLGVIDENGAYLFNVTQPEKPMLLRPLLPRGLLQRLDRFRIAGLEVGTHIDLGSDGGKIPTEENDYIYLGINTTANQMDRISLLIIKISEPLQPQIVGRTEPINSRNLRDVKLAKVYNAPFLNTYALLSHQEGVTVVNVTKSTTPETVTTLLDRVPCVTTFFEEMPLDQMISTDGDPLKDISHPEARYLNQEEISKILAVPLGNR